MKKLFAILFLLVTGCFAQKGRPQQFGPYNLCPDTPGADQLLVWNTGYNCWKPTDSDRVLGRSALPTAGAIPKVTAAGTLGPSAVAESSTAVTVTDKTLSAAPGGAIPAWKKYRISKVDNDGVDCTGAAIGAVSFTGTGLDDATSGGTYTAAAAHTYTVIIDGAGTPDTFKWQEDSGTFTEGVEITGEAQTLANGVTVTFGATTGHTATDQWTIAATVIGCWKVNDNAAVDSETDTSQDVAAFELPANGFVDGLRVKTATACAGATTIKLGVGTAGNGVVYRAADYDAKAAVSATNLSNTLAAAGSTTAEATNVTFRVVSTVENVDAIDTGCAVDVWLKWGVLP